MSGLRPEGVSRRNALIGVAATFTAGSALGAGAPTATAVSPSSDLPGTGRPPLWRQARRNGIVFGSSIATWQLDARHRRLHAREAGLLLTEDDLLWHRLKPDPDAPLDFDRGDRIVDVARRHQQLTVGAHLAWDEGFGPGWTDEWDLRRRRAERLLYGTVRQQVRHYRGRMDAWIVANEVTDPEHHDRRGLRTNVPWYQTIGPPYVGECFHIAADADPRALRILNEFGFETPDERGNPPEPRRRVFLTAVDALLDAGVPVQAVGIQGHLHARGFHRHFDERRYRAFLQELAERGLDILITELDVHDRGLPTRPGSRDRRVADTYRHYLDVALDERAVKAVIAFGLTDRYTWLDEDQPRRDGTHRRPLAFDRAYRPKPAYTALSDALRSAPRRRPLWQAHRPG